MIIKTTQFGYEMNASATYTEKMVFAQETYAQILERKKAEQADVIANGSTEEPIQLGAKSYTQAEWDEFLENFDAVADDVREQMRAEHQKRYEEHLEKMQEMKKMQEKIWLEKEAVHTESISFTTSNHEIIADNEYKVFHVYNHAGEKVGTLPCKTEEYEEVLSFLRLQKVTGGDIENSALWKEFLKKSEINIESKHLTE